jgi:hypothetical protein
MRKLKEKKTSVLDNGSIRLLTRDLNLKIFVQFRDFTHSCNLKRFVLISILLRHIWLFHAICPELQHSWGNPSLVFVIRLYRSC